MSKYDVVGGKRGWIVSIAIGYTLFVVYASLVPLEYRGLPLSAAVDRFAAIPYLDLGIRSRADWVANILLFVPLAFLWLGTLWSASSARCILATVAVVLSSVVLSLAIEFTQIFFPPRTVSLNDIVAETIGSVFGVGCWWAFGVRTLSWFDRFGRVQGRKAVFGFLLTAYLLLLFAYSLLPLDLTLSPAELGRKWSEGKLRLMPFQGWDDLSAFRFGYKLATDIAIWAIPAALYVAAGTRSMGSIFVLMLGMAVVLEFLQVFVYSRIADVTDILTAAVGILVGTTVAARWQGRHGDSVGSGTRKSERGGSLLWLVAAAAWVLVLLTVFWYPFDFRTDWSFVQDRLAAFRRVPFELLYFDSEFHAVTQVLRKLGFFFPLGAIGALMVQRRWIASPGLRLCLHVIAAVMLSAGAAMVEIGQLFLPTRHGDLTDWLLYSFGAWGGYALTLFVMARSRERR